ncbi:MAG: hypothetical protein HZB16_08295 [Armatimonadetes bacterium]|nr:hypothetical protein [Armatimonadota bacterium]
MRLPWIVLLLPVAAFCQTLTEDFAGYRDEAALAANWRDDSMGYSLRDGQLVGEEGLCFWQRAPFAGEATLSADLRIEAVAGSSKGWSVAGIGFAADRGNLWALQVVAGPEKDGVRPRFLEMHEMLDGTWLAESAETTKLRSLANEVTGQWRDQQAYRLEMTWNAEQVEGRILSGGTAIGRFAWALTGAPRAVTAGRPVFRVAGLTAGFDNVSYGVRRVVAEPQPKAPPAWVSRPGKAIAKGTGYFATAQVNGRWWLVDPEGKPFFDVGTDHVRYEGHWCEKLGYAPYSRVSAAKYASEDAWAQTATDRLKSWNFNTVAAGHSPSTRHRGLAHILFASFGSGFAARDYIAEQTTWTGFPNVFSPQWPRYCTARARQMADEMAGDPWCLGIFLDNELEWYGKTGSLIDEVFRRGPTHTAKLALWDWLLKRYGTVAGVNAALGTRHADAAAFLADTNPPRGPKSDEVNSGFMQVIAERYFGEPCRALRAADGKHLIMGCRFAGQTPKEVLAAAGKYNDVFTINTYPKVDIAGGRVVDTPRMLADYYAAVRKPMIITEWSFPALDAGLPCLHGAGMRVDTQAQKARCYEIFANQIADLPFMVGYHYFMYLDEPAEGISSTFPEDSNYGLVNVKDEPYAELTDMATKVNAAAYARHERSAMPSAADLPTKPAPPADGKPAALRNLGKTEVVGLPAVVDGASPGLGIIASLAPGATWRPAAGSVAAPEAMESVALGGAGTTWVCDRRLSGLFGKVTADGLALGRVDVAAHQVTAGKNAWTSAEKVESIQVRGGKEGVILDVVLSHQREGQDGAPSFRVGVRAVHFFAEPVVLVRPLWYENTDDRPFEIKEAFVFCQPAIGGDTADDKVGGPGVPQYYREVGAWTDSKLGGSFGAFCPQEDWSVSFWEDTGKHADARIMVDRTLAKGQKIVLGQLPYLTCFGLKAAGADRALSARWLPVGQLRVVPGG